MNVVCMACVWKFGVNSGTYAWDCHQSYNTSHLYCKSTHRNTMSLIFYFKFITTTPTDFYIKQLKDIVWITNET